MKKLEPIWDDEKCCCPVCGSKKILRMEQCVVYKVYSENTGAQLNPHTLKSYMSNREKALEYDNASPEGVGCWNYQCTRCGWQSEIFVE